MLLSYIKHRRQQELQEQIRQLVVEADHSLIDWNKRRLEAEKNNNPFDEPPPLPSTTITLDSTLSLNWQSQDAQGQYYQLSSLDLNTPYLSNLEGVYIIWYKDQSGTPVTLYIGQSNQIGRRLHHHHTNLDQKYSGRILQVAWAPVPQQDLRSRIERYLFDILKPSEIKRAPNGTTTPVNLPPPWGTM